MEQSPTSTLDINFTCVTVIYLLLQVASGVVSNIDLTWLKGSWSVTGDIICYPYSQIR